MRIGYTVCTGQTSEIWKGRANLPKVLILWMSACFGKNYSKSYNILLPYVLFAYIFKGHVHVFAGRVKIVSHSSCRTSAILKFFHPVMHHLPGTLTSKPTSKPWSRSNDVWQDMYLMITKQEPQDASQRCFTTLNRSHLKIGQAHALQNAGDM